MNLISVNYSLIWQHKDQHHYKFTRCKKCFNTKRGKQIKMVLNGGSLGFWISGKFETLSKLRLNVEKIKNTNYPF